MRGLRQQQRGRSRSRRRGWTSNQMLALLQASSSRPQRNATAYVKDPDHQPTDRRQHIRHAKVGTRFFVTGAGPARAGPQLQFAAKAWVIELPPVAFATSVVTRSFRSSSAMTFSMRPKPTAALRHASNYASDSDSNTKGALVVWLTAIASIERDLLRQRRRSSRESDPCQQVEADPPRRHLECATWPHCS